MRKFLYRIYWKLEKIIHPGLRFSQEHYAETLDRGVPAKCDRWLDLGCGHQMLAAWMLPQEKRLAARARRLVGMDRDLPALRNNPVITDRVYGNIEVLPFGKESFDLVTANMVVEHLENPGSVLDEVRRVLRPGGTFIFHTTNRDSVMMRLARLMPQSMKNWLAGVLEGRAEEDVFRTYYRMNTPGDISRRAATAKFAVSEIRAVNTTAVSAVTPFCVVELVYLRFLERPGFAGLRSNLIVTLHKPGG